MPPSPLASPPPGEGEAEDAMDLTNAHLHSLEGVDLPAGLTVRTERERRERERSPCAAAQPGGPSLLNPVSPFFSFLLPRPST